MKPKLKTLFNIFVALSLFMSVSVMQTMPAAALGSGGKCEASLQPADCGITSLIVIGIRILSGLVGVVVVAMITVGGIQYALARDNPQAVSAAKQKIFNAILALVAYLSIFAFLQWLVPGGIV